MKAVQLILAGIATAALCPVLEGAWSNVVKWEDGSGYQYIELFWGYETGSAYKFLPQAGVWAYPLADNAAWQAMVLWQDNTGWQYFEQYWAYDPDPQGPWKYLLGAGFWIYLQDAGGDTGGGAGFATVEPGTFMMGSPTDEPGRTSFDFIPREVTLTRAYLIQKTEVTWGEWNEVRDWALANGYTDLNTGRNGLNGDSSGLHPVVEVSWYDAAKWLNAKTEMENALKGANLTPCYTLDGGIFRTGEVTPDCDFTATGYRLPTEAEWERACRAGTGTAFHSGPITNLGKEPVDPNLDLIGWYGGNSQNTRGTNDSHQAGLKQPNAWGIYDMSGNVTEMVWDWYAGSYTETVDPTGPAGTDASSPFITKGGNFISRAEGCRSGSRGYDYKTRKNYNSGFRAARTR